MKEQIIKNLNLVKIGYLDEQVQFAFGKLGKQRARAYRLENRIDDLNDSDRNYFEVGRWIGSMQDGLSIGCLFFSSIGYDPIYGGATLPLASLAVSKLATNAASLAYQKYDSLRKTMKGGNF